MTHSCPSATETCTNVLEGDAQFRQVFLHGAAGLGEVVQDFGDLVQVTPDAHQPVMEGGGLGKEIGGRRACSSGS